jgi:hypothetical protein
MAESLGNPSSVFVDFQGYGFLEILPPLTLAYITRALRGFGRNDDQAPYFGK